MCATAKTQPNHNYINKQANLLKQNLPHNVGDIASISGQGTKVLHAVEQLLRLGIATSVCALQQEILHDTTKFPFPRLDLMQQNKESKYLFKKSTHQLLQKYLLAF